MIVALINTVSAGWVARTHARLRTMLLYGVCLVLCVHSAVSTEVYRTERAQLLEQEARQALGGNETLSNKERDLNNCLMQHKFLELDNAFEHPELFMFSKHFFEYKKMIAHSKVYKIIKDMPKGAVLHVHDMGILNPDYVLNITYMDHLYVCFDSTTAFRFSRSTPNETCSNKWRLMSEIRQSSKDTIQFDAELRKNFTMVCDNPDLVYPDIGQSWSTFMKYFGTVVGLLTYRPVWEQYFFDVLHAFREDNVMYLEVRSILPNLYELDGSVFEPVVTAKAYRKSIIRFVKKYPDFIGAKLIYAPSRLVDRDGLESYLDTARKIKKETPEIFAGFDLVGQEDLGNPLIAFVPQLEEAGRDLDYFFHAGETDWYGTLTDENLVDAILLGAKRLGHAYALTKHPVLIEEVRKRDIGLEVNVISNTVLSLVRDVRNHPLAAFLAEGLPVVLSSDDPGIWEANPISDDFYVAFVGIASRLSDLRLLKTLAVNSLKYSALNELEKKNALKMFNKSWNRFVDEFRCYNY